MEGIGTAMDPKGGGVGFSSVKEFRGKSGNLRNSSAVSSTIQPGERDL